MIPRRLTDKILVIGPQYKPVKGGIAAVLQEYSQLFETFRFVATTGGPSRLSKGLYLLSALCKVPYLILTKGIEVVHIHGASYSSFYRKRIFIYLSRFLGAKVVYHIHGGGFEHFYRTGNSPRILQTLQKCDLVVVLSEHWRHFFADELALPHVQIVNNIIGAPRLHPAEKSNFKLLYLGHITKEKGIFDLIDVIDENRALFEGRIELHIGGGLYEVDRMVALLKERSLEKIIVFHGWVSGDQKAKLLSDCNAFILPSYYEGMPITILEAMSYGMPVISTCVGGIPEIVTEDVNGILVHPGDKDALRKAILKLAEDKILQQQMGEEAKKAARPFMPEEVEQVLVTIYSGLLAK